MLVGCAMGHSDAGPEFVLIQEMCCVRSVANTEKVFRGGHPAKVDYRYCPKTTDNTNDIVRVAEGCTMECVPTSRYVLEGDVRFFVHVW